MSNVYVNIIANASNAVEEFGRLKTRTTDLERGIAKVQKNLNSFGSAATKYLTVPIAAGTTALTLATKEAMTFGKSMTEVSTLLDNVTKTEFESFKNEVLDFSTQMGIASNKVVPALYQSLSAGVPKDNVFEFLEAAGKASIAGVTDLETSVDGLSSVVNAYGSDVINVNQASDLMFTTVKLGKTNFEELSKSLYNVIPTASSLGVEFKDVSAALATITTQGTPTSVATTQIRGALDELSKEGSKVDKIFREISGGSFADFIASGGDLQGALQLLETHSERTGTALNNFFSSSDAGKAVLQLTGNASESFSNALKEMNSSLNATNTAFEKMNDDPIRKFEMAKVEVENLVIALGQKLMPIVSEQLLPLLQDTLIPIAEDLITAIGKAIDIFNSLPTPIQNASLGFIALTAAIGPSAIAIAQMGTAYTTTTTAISSAKDIITLAKTTFTGVTPTILAKNVALKASAVAWKSLNTAINLTPVGLLVTIAALFAGLVIKTQLKAKADKEAYEAAIKQADALKQTATNTINLTRQTRTLTDRYQELAEKTELTTIEQIEQQSIVNQLKELYPDLDIAYDNNGRVIGNLTKMVDALNDARRQEELQSVAAQKATLSAEIKKREQELDECNRRLNEISESEETYALVTIIKQEEEQANQRLKSLNERLEETLELEKKLKETTTTKTDSNTTMPDYNPNPYNNSGGSGGSDGTAERTKTFKDYLAELEKSLEMYDRQQKSLEEINAEYDNTDTIKNRNEIITNAIEEMAHALKLEKDEVQQLGEAYGYAFLTDKVDSAFESMRAQIEANKKAYEEEVLVRRELGEVISDEAVAIGLKEIERQGVLNIVDALELSQEEVQKLKDEFGDLFKEIEQGGQTSLQYFKENWASVSNELLGITSGFAVAGFQLYTDSLERQLDSLETRKQTSIDAINEELAAYLEANDLMEQTEAERLAASIEELEERQALALGLYEQERIAKALEEEQANLARVEAEDEATQKLLEIEEQYAIEQAKLKYKQDMANWQSQLLQATVATAQAIVNAVNSGAQYGIAAPAMIPIISGLAAGLTAVQIAVIAANKPQESNYLASGGLVRRRAGGVNAVIGEGNSNEAVIPLEDNVLAGIGHAIANATDSNSNTSDSQDDDNNYSVQQPVFINLDGKTVGSVLLEMTKRGVKVIHRRGIV